MAEATVAASKSALTGIRLGDLAVSRTTLTSAHATNVTSVPLEAFGLADAILFKRSSIDASNQEKMPSRGGVAGTCWQIYPFK